MSLRILRWKGGSGGDMILYLKSLSSPGSVINADFDCISFAGKIKVDFSKFNSKIPTDIEKIGLHPEMWTDQIDLKKLSTEIDMYRTESTDLWAKSHYYATNQFDNITVDLVVTPESLPFVVFSNIVKTDTIDTNFNKLSALITDPVVKTNYALYSVAVDFVTNYKASGHQQLQVSDLLCDLKTFKTATNNINLGLNFNHTIYQHWLEKNQQYIPSKNYLAKVATQNYDFTDLTLNLAERYSLMALAGCKFINLKDFTI